MQLSNVEKLAELARIEINQEEKENLMKDLGVILEYVGQIQEARVTEVKDGYVLRNVMREDEKPHESGIYSEKLLAEAPEVKDKYIKVKKIL